MSKPLRRHTNRLKKQSKAQVELPPSDTQGGSGWGTTTRVGLLLSSLLIATVTVHGAMVHNPSELVMDDDSRLHHINNNTEKRVQKMVVVGNESVFDHCSSQPYREAAERCASYVKDGSINKFPPNSQYVVRCHSGAMQRHLDEAKVNEEWRKRNSVIRGASAKLETDDDGGAERGSVGALYARFIAGHHTNHAFGRLGKENDADLPPIDDALSLTLLQHEIVEAPGMAFDTLSPTVDPSSDFPANPVYLGQVLHGGVSPATMMTQSHYMRKSLKLAEAFEAVESKVTREALRLLPLNVKDMVNKVMHPAAGSGGGEINNNKEEEGKAARAWKRELLATLIAKGRIRINSPAYGTKQQEQPTSLLSLVADLVSRVTVHPDTILVELGTGAATLLYPTCPPDPFDLSTVCLGSDTVRVFLAGAVVNAPHIRLSQGYGFPTLPPAAVTHVLSHGISTAICEECMCGHIAEALRLLRPGGRLSVWMLRTGHHTSNSDPSYFDGTDFGEGVGIIDAFSNNGSTTLRRGARQAYKLAPQALTGDAFFFMDKCRRKYGIYLSPYVDKDSLSVNVREPTVLYSACFERDGFFSVSLLRSDTPWDAYHHPNPLNAGAKPPMTPADFIALPTHAQRLNALATHARHLPQMLNVKTDLCRSQYDMTPLQQRELAERIVEMGRVPHDKALEHRQPRSGGGGDNRPPIALKFLPQALQAWVVDLILANLSSSSPSLVFSSSSSSSSSPSPLRDHRPLPMAWFKRRLLNDMVLERSARINNASRLFAKCKKSKQERYWCYRDGYSATQRARDCDH